MDANCPTFASMDEIQLWALRRTLTSEFMTLPRGMATREVIGPSFTLTNPRRRCVTNRERRWSFPLALGEFCWHLAGSDDLAFVAHYAPRWREFSEDNATIWGSCYGRRLFEHVNGRLSQWDMMVDLLRYDPMSRRAVLNFQQEPIDALRAQARDTACASVLQFLVRNGAVHAIAYMRSNDVVLGLPYDVFLFTMLQEMLATTLNLELGNYHHIAGSLHLYERHFGFAERIISRDDMIPFQMPSMSQVHDIPRFLLCEAAIRTGSSEETGIISSYWAGLLSVLRFHSAKRTATPEALRQYAGTSPYEVVILPLVEAELERRIGV